jgi:hypothetical protein
MHHNIHKTNTSSKTKKDFLARIQST